ncbi:MAG: MBL fold metallo-hydrolase [Chloroflexi bacterium]|nr:MBL fold metallo-hydrolase [Chloroflexota bacterium]
MQRWLPTSRPARLALQLVVVGLGLVIFSLASAGPEASTPPFGSDLPFKAFGPLLAADSSGVTTPGPATGFQVVFIDVGQGDATLITVGSQRLLIDGGRPEDLVTQRLQALGVTDLDAVVATHSDADHVGGLVRVLATFAVERIYVNGDPPDTQIYTDFLAAAATEPGAQVLTLSRGQSVTLGGLQLPVLNPASLSGDTNTDSVVLRLSCGTVSVQFEGDADQPAEQSMIAAGLAADVDVLKVGHHGSNTSSSLAFLQAEKPEVAVISAGLTNPYGHPAPETLARLATVGASLVRTDTTAGDDSVVMTSDCQTYSFYVTPTPAPPVPTPTATVTPTPTPTPTPTTAVTCGSATATITALDKVGEVVTVSGAGLMTGWYIISESGNQRFDFPSGFTLSGSVQVKSGTPQFANSATMLWWSAAALWTNSSDDDAFLYNCQGSLVSTFEDGTP